jgi:hypothetical protein
VLLCCPVIQNYLGAGLENEYIYIYIYIYIYVFMLIGVSDDVLMSYPVMILNV